MIIRILSAYISTISPTQILPPLRLFLACLASSFDSSLPAMMMMYPPGIFPAGLPVGAREGGNLSLCCSGPWEREGGIQL